jgi:hypothetical protein
VDLQQGAPTEKRSQYSASGAQGEEKIHKAKSGKHGSGRYRERKQEVAYVNDETCRLRLSKPLLGGKKHV